MYRQLYVRTADTNTGVKTVQKMEFIDIAPIHWSCEEMLILKGFRTVLKLKVKITTEYNRFGLVHTLTIFPVRDWSKLSVSVHNIQNLWHSATHGLRF